MSVNILGAGYVGLTLGIYMANQGKKVRMIEIDKSKIEKLKLGISPVHEDGIQEELTKAIYSKNISFTTDTDSEVSNWIIAISYFPGEPEKFLDVLRNIKYQDHIKPVIMIRTTIPSGFINDQVIPALEDHFQGKMDQTFYIVSAPERSLSGNAINELRDLPQIIGGSEISVKMATRVFEDVGIEVIGLQSYEASELVKSFSNFARLVQFNLSNYLGALCSFYKIDQRALLNAMKKNYPRMDFISEPGTGVGGFCLPKDSLVMYDSLKEASELTDEFRNITDFPLIQYNLNESIIRFNANQIEEKLNENMKILALGIAFKGEPNTDDTRDSVGLKIADYLKKKGYPIKVNDLSVSKEKIEGHGHIYSDLSDISDFDAILFLNNDRRYKEVIKSAALEAKFKEKVVLYDPWKIFLNSNLSILEETIDLTS